MAKPQLPVAQEVINKSSEADSKGKTIKEARRLYIYIYIYCHY